MLGVLILPDDPIVYIYIYWYLFISKDYSFVPCLSKFWVYFIFIFNCC